MKPVSSARLMSQNVLFESLKAMALPVSRESSEVVAELKAECASLRHWPFATASMNAVGKQVLAVRLQVIYAHLRSAGWVTDV